QISHAEFVDKSQAAAVELQALRRSRQESQGCSCAHLRVEKLSVAKLREELKRRGRVVSKTKRELSRALTAALKEDAASKGPGQGELLCVGDQCQCARDGK
ncbi:unnamed protein product, partial [Discosporangium mesarthrocarpum]